MVQTFCQDHLEINVVDQRTIRVIYKYAAETNFGQNLPTHHAVMVKPTITKSKSAVKVNCTENQVVHPVVTAEITIAPCPCAVVVEYSADGGVRLVVNHVIIMRRAIFVAMIELLQKPCMDHPAVVPVPTTEVFNYAAQEEYFEKLVEHLAVALKPINQAHKFAVTIEYFQKIVARLAVVL